jgi:tetratricopeptide (TPR) repeat protein
VRIGRIYQSLAIVCVILTVYYSALFAEYLTVDDNQMIDGLLNQNSVSLKGLFFPGGGGYYYRPLLYLTFIMDKHLWGLHESFMHLENILLHCANSLLVYGISSRIARCHHLDMPYLPLAAALLFGLHPIVTEPVNWISGRTDLLAGFFVLSALLLLIRSVEEESRFVMFLAAVAFFTATLAKETVLFWYPGSLLMVYALDRSPENGSFLSRIYSFLSKRWQYLALLTLVPVAYFSCRHLAFGKGDGGIGLAAKGVVAGDLDLMNKARITLKVFGFYLKKLVLPLPLNFATMNVSDWYVILGLGGIVLIAYLLYRHDTIAVLLLMSLSIISPALLVPLGRMAWTPVAERYLYMPAALFIIAVSLTVAGLVTKKWIPAGVVAFVTLIIVTASGYASYQRNLVWQTNLELFTDCVAKSPDCAAVKNELAAALENRGRSDEASVLYLANSVPQQDKFGIIADINKSRALANKGEFADAVALLKSRNEDGSKPLYDQYLKNLIYLNSRLADSQDDPRKSTALRKENIELLIKLQQINGDIYQFYLIGKEYLGVGDKQNAARYFRMAYERSAPEVFYHEPARKLAERLERSGNRQ